MDTVSKTEFRLIAATTPRTMPKTTVSTRPAAVSSRVGTRLSPSSVETGSCWP